jgi:Big-like domain-containing protein
MPGSSRMSAGVTKNRWATWVMLLPVLVWPTVLANAAILAGSFDSAPKGTVVNLSAEGSLDWVHWGLYTETSLDRKASVTPEISDFSLAFPTNFPGFAYQFSDNWSGYSWSDGTPDTTINDTTTGVYTVGLGHGFRFSVPAGTAVKTLKVFVGAYGAGGEFQASLSDNSAAAYTNSSLTNVSNGPNGVYTLTFAGRSPGSVLNVKWTVASMEDTNYGNVTLQSAALSSTNANNPPFVQLTSPLENATFNAGANITLAASATDFDGTIAKVEFFEGTTKLGEHTSSPYDFTWNLVPAGRYLLSARATDNSGAVANSEPVDIFVNSTGGTLSGSVLKPPTLSTLVNLTAEGSADWVHWGSRTNGGLDRKVGVGEQISDFTSIGPEMPQQFADNYTGFSWTDGTPTATAVDTTTGMFIPGLGNGFELTVPADTLTRTLKVYTGLYGGIGNFQAWLSDFSAKAYADTSLSNFFGNAYAAYTLTYAAASPGQILTIRFTSRALFDADFGNVTLQSATLVGGSSTNGAAGSVALFNPRWVGNVFTFSFASETGATYSAQFNPFLGSSNWQVLTTLSGSGTTLNVTNQNPSSAARFYRVQTK